MSKKKRAKVRKYRRKKVVKSRSRVPMLLVGIGAALIVVVAAWFVFNRGDNSTDNEVTGDPPRLEVDKELIDFGDVPVNEYVTARFRVTNTGGQILRFTKQPYVKLVEGC